MGFYPEKVNRRFQRPQNGGKPAAGNASGTGASFLCGSVLRLGLRIDPKSKEIEEARFLTDGCGFAVASADFLAERLKGKKLTELHGAVKSELRDLIEGELGRFPPDRKHCPELFLDALTGALADFRARQIGEFAGEKAMICTCFGVSEERIENLIGAEALETVEEIGRACQAGTGCGSCQPLIREILDSHNDIFN
ncbi:MAG: iron-sulfur cluster assembly scaffold protein [Pyrinomonadaceae bacterium]